MPKTKDALPGLTSQEDYQKLRKFYSNVFRKIKRAEEILYKITSAMEGYQSYCEYNNEPICDICQYYGEAKEVLEELRHELQS